MENNSDQIELVEKESKPSIEPCPECNLVELMLAISTANTACNLLDDQEKRDECRSWANGLNPDEVQNAQDIVWNTIQRVGVEPVSNFSSKWNDLIQTTIIQKVGEKIEAGEKVDPQLEQLFKVFSAKRGV